MLGKADTPANEGKQEGVQWETTGDKTVGKANTPSNKGSQEGVQWEAQGDKTLRKADAPSNKRKQEGVQWAMGDKGKQERRGTMGDKWRQDLGEGGHTIQHQGGHLKKALRTPNSTPLGDQEGRQGETRGVNLSPREGGHTSQQRETRSGKRGVKGRKEETRLSGSRHHPTKGKKEGNQKGNKKGDKGRQDSGEGGHTIQRGDR